VRCFRTSGLLARRRAAGVRLFTCNGYDWTELPLIAERAKAGTASVRRVSP
jgi:hypothetical protein